MSSQRRDHHPRAQSHRHSLTAHQIGRVHHQHLGLVKPCIERFPVPCRSIVSPAASGVARRQIHSPPLKRQHDQIAAFGETIPGKNRSPIRGDRGGISTSASPESRLKSWSVDLSLGHVFAGRRGSTPGRRPPPDRRDRAQPADRLPLCVGADQGQGPFASLNVTKVGSPRFARPMVSRNFPIRGDARAHAVTDADRRQQVILLEQGGRVLAQVGRQGLAGAARQQAFCRTAPRSRRSPATIGTPISANSK